MPSTTQALAGAAGTAIGGPALGAVAAGVAGLFGGGGGGGGPLSTSDSDARRYVLMLENVAPWWGQFMAQHGPAYVDAKHQGNAKWIARERMIRQWLASHGVASSPSSSSSAPISGGLAPGAGLVASVGLSGAQVNATSTETLVVLGGLTLLGVGIVLAVTKL